MGSLEGCHCGSRNIKNKPFNTKIHPRYESMADNDKEIVWEDRYASWALMHVMRYTGRREFKRFLAETHGGKEPALQAARAALASLVKEEETRLRFTPIGKQMDPCDDAENMKDICWDESFEGWRLECGWGRRTRRRSRGRPNERRKNERTAVLFCHRVLCRNPLFRTQ